MLVRVFPYLRFELASEGEGPSCGCFPHLCQESSGRPILNSRERLLGRNYAPARQLNLRILTMLEKSSVQTREPGSAWIALHCGLLLSASRSFEWRAITTHQ